MYNLAHVSLVTELPISQHHTILTNLYANA